MAPPKGRPLLDGRAGRDAPVLPPGSPRRSTARAVAGGLTAAPVVAPTKSGRVRATRDASSRRQGAKRSERLAALTAAAAEAGRLPSTSTVQDNLYDFATGTWGNPDSGPGSPV